MSEQRSLAAVGGGLLGRRVFTAYWFAYRPHLPYAEPARYRNTNSLIMPAWMKPLEWFWLGQNLHSVHHLFPRVPFDRYHALHRRIELATPRKGVQHGQALANPPASSMPRATRTTCSPT